MTVEQWASDDRTSGGMKRSSGRKKGNRGWKKKQRATPHANAGRGYAKDCSIKEKGSRGEYSV